MRWPKRVNSEITHNNSGLRGHPSSESQEEGNIPALSKCPTTVFFLLNFLSLPPLGFAVMPSFLLTVDALYRVLCSPRSCTPGGHTSPFPERRMAVAVTRHQENLSLGSRWPNSPSESVCMALFTPRTSKHTILPCDFLHIFILLSLFTSLLEVPRVCFVERAEFLSVK